MHGAHCAHCDQILLLSITFLSTALSLKLELFSPCILTLKKGCLQQNYVLRTILRISSSIAYSRILILELP